MFTRTLCPTALTALGLVVGCSSAGQSPGQSPDGGPSLDGAQRSDTSSSDSAPSHPDGGSDSPTTSSCPAASSAVDCNSVTGLAAPLTNCATGAPCQPPFGEPKISTEITLPTCMTSSTAVDRAFFDDSPPMMWADVNGDQRAACVYKPADAHSAPRPLLVFLHGSGGSADDIYNYTSLRAQAESSSLSTEGARLGFILASMQGRNLHLTWEPNFEGSHHDQWFRDLGSPSCNPDIRSMDYLIDTLVASGDVDAGQIYVSGWSNGSFFGEEYAIARHTTPTPGGNVVAATALYAGADPFDNLSSAQEPSCKLGTYPMTSVPTFMIHRDCDALVACDAQQNSEFSLPPGGDVTDWLATLGTVEDDMNISQTLIGGNGELASACLTVADCPEETGVNNHLHWPDGVADGSGMDWEPDMLQFLKNHPNQ
jgi:predicted esterase